MDKKIIAITGMACAGCAANVEKCLRRLDGITVADVNFATRTASVEYDPTLISPQTMKEEVIKAGYDLIIDEGQSLEIIERNSYQKLIRQVLTSWIFALLTM